MELVNNPHYYIMANKRYLKKSINYICSELFSECVAASLYSGKPNQENVDALLTAILAVHANYLSRVSHPEPGMKAKAYFRDLIGKFNKEAADLVDQISNLN